MFFLICSFTISFPFENEEPVVKELNPELIKNINWQLVLEKWENKDYTNLPTRTEFEKLDIQDFLLSIGVLQKQVNPNMIINGQPVQNISVNSDYRIVYAAEQVNEIIDIRKYFKGSTTISNYSRGIFNYIVMMINHYN